MLGGSPYGMGGFGDTVFPAPKVAISGGYGGDPYGLSPYGSSDITSPRVSSVVSLNGFEVEVFFSEEMDLANPLLTDPTSYVLVAVVGAPAAPVSAFVESVGSVNVVAGDMAAGALSVIVRHTGTTLGGTYNLVVSGPTDIAGNPILNTDQAFLAKGEPPNYVISPLSGTNLLVTFDQDMLPSSQEPALTTGIDSASSYEFSSSPDYPIPLTVEGITHPYLGDLAQVSLTVKGQTSLDYTSNIVPAKAFDYEALVLPDLDPNLAGTEVNPAGGSSSILSGTLRLNKTNGFTYGWVWADTSGIVVADLSTFRVDLEFDAGSAIYTPALSSVASPELAVLTVEDGSSGSGVQIRITLQRNAFDEDEIRIQSGAYDQVVAAAWSTGVNKITAIRNRKADIYTILFNDCPLASTAIANMTATGSLIGGPGAAFIFNNEAYAVSGFSVSGLTYNASNTIFSGAWNFLHETGSQFIGSALLTRDRLLTRRGPLVKGWGDATPATKQDVVVRVAGTEVEVQSVNPYIGLVILTVPIPLLPVGDPLADVKVDYKWMASPTMCMVGLNTPGLTLNKSALQRGHHDPAFHGEQIQDADNPKGAMESTTRFPYTVVLGPCTDRPAPIQIGHRYLGFETEYSSLLNNPNTLLLNQIPYRTSLLGFRRTPGGVSESYEGTSTPQASEPVWSLNGTDTGFVNVNQGTYTLIDATDGSYDPSNPTAATYSRETDLTFPSFAYLVARFQVDCDNTTPDGVFTGVGFGLHDNRRLYLAGALLINDVKHVGMLLDPTRPERQGSWSVGPVVSGEILTSTIVRTTAEDLPSNVSVGDRFQILDGGQAGVYTITGYVLEPDCIRALLTVSPAFPADFGLLGNKYPTLVPELDWCADMATYRLEVDVDQFTAVLQVSGSRSDVVATLDESLAAPVFPLPSETSLLLNTGDGGQVFWGSLSMEATNETLWSFFRYGIVPDASAFTSRGEVILAEMNVLPEYDPNDEWCRTHDFGFSVIDATADRVLLKSTSSDPGLAFDFAYKRLEPFLIPDAIVDLQTRFQVESGTLGAGDAQVIINDTLRQIVLANLLYLEFTGQVVFRRLLRMPSLSMSGIRLPTVQGDWGEASSNELTISVHESILTMVQGGGLSGGYIGTLDKTGIGYTDNGSRIIEARFGVPSYTTNVTGDVGVMFGSDVGASPGPYGFVGMMLRAPFGATPAGVRLVTVGSVVIQEYDFDWTGGAFHSYRIMADADADTVALVIDDVVQTPTLTLAANFSGGSGNTATFFGALGLDTLIASTVEWKSLSVVAYPPADAKRTLGVWLGGDKTLINSWEIPRTDSSTAPNSAEVGPVVEEMDWRSELDVRLLRDPGWGVTVFRPDLPLPPFYTPETPGVPGTGFITRTTEPSAGWINVEYSQLPILGSTFGFVSFGAPDKESITQQRWAWMRYRFFRNLTDDFRAPQGMVLNRANVISSGERSRDVTPEIVAIQSLNNTQVSILPAHIFADRVFKVIDGEDVYTEEAWSFEHRTQTITLLEDENGSPRTFSGDQVPVTVVFSPGKPVTKTYLEAQPLLDSVTLLNEGTPPIPLSQTGETSRVIVHGGALNNPNLVVNDPPSLQLNNPYQVVTFEDNVAEDPLGDYYDGLCFIEVDDDGTQGLLSGICEGFLGSGESGWSDTEQAPVGAFVLDLSGSLFTECGFSPVEQIPFNQGAGSPGSILYASGGSFVGPVFDSNGDPIPGELQALGGHVGPGTALVYPNWPSHNAVPGMGQGALQRDVDWFIRTSSLFSSLDPLVEVDLVETLSSPAGDNVPPSLSPSESPNPDGAPGVGGFGAVFAEMATAGDYSRSGPWAGMGSLAPDPDLGFFDFGATIVDGTTVTVTEKDGPTVATFVARLVPTLPNEFAIAPQPHVNLAAIINADAVASTFVFAEAGLNLAGDPSVLISALAPVVPGNNLAITTSDPSSIKIAGTLLIASGEGILTGGAKITQSSLAGGGTVSLQDGVHNGLLCFKVEGGVALPQGSSTSFVV